MKKRLITAALPYVNNIPHLGNIIGCVLSADVFARYCRSKGYETLFICGTDEYGTATEIKAYEEGISPKELCDKYYVIHKKIYEWFGISTDIFGRTSTPLHTEITHEIFLDLYKNGYIVEDEIIQAYDEKAQMFLADRYIEGTCPYCGYEQARADQCDKCGRLLNFDELINPISKISKTKPIKKSSKHLFIDLPNIEKELEDWIEKTSKEGFWSENSYQIAKAWLKEGLKKRCITRDLKWGVKVPLKGWEEKVFYVWFDAPIGYISITANYTEKWREWWQNPSQVELYQFMGKDNVPFHTVVFPATLIGTRKNWTLLYHISTTEFLNYEGGKFSKSRGIGVFGNDAVESGIPADVWRYYLLTNRPEKTDTNFTWTDFAEKLNNELLANIGNLVNRVLVFLEREFQSQVPNYKISDEDLKFLNAQKEKFKEIDQLLEKVKIKDALHLCMQAGKEANSYFQYNQPWKLIREDKERCGSVLYILANQIKDLAIVLEPFLPFTSKEIFSQLNIEPKNWKDLGELSIKPLHKIGKPKILFRKIEKEQIEYFAKKYSGKQVENENKDEEKIDTKIELEVGKIIEIKKHPNAEKLYIEKVQLKDKIIQLVSGLVPYYKPEELLNQKILVVKNLQPAKLRGEISEGMLLAAENEKGEVEVLIPQADVGSRVIMGNEQYPKEKISLDEFFKVKMEVKNYILYVNEKPVKIQEKEIKTTKIKNGIVK